MSCDKSYSSWYPGTESLYKHRSTDSARSSMLEQGNSNGLPGSWWYAWQRHSSVQSLDWLGCHWDMGDDSAEILFHFFLQEALVSSSGMGRYVQSLMLSIQHFLCRTWHRPPFKEPWMAWDMPEPCNAILGGKGQQLNPPAQNEFHKKKFTFSMALRPYNC